MALETLSMDALANSPEFNSTPSHRVGLPKAKNNPASLCPGRRVEHTLLESRQA